MAWPRVDKRVLARSRDYCGENWCTSSLSPHPKAGMKFRRSDNRCKHSLVRSLTLILRHSKHSRQLLHCWQIEGQACFCFGPIAMSCVTLLNVLNSSRDSFLSDESLMDSGCMLWQRPNSIYTMGSRLRSILRTPAEKKGCMSKFVWRLTWGWKDSCRGVSGR
jgi:hypothetical protein